MSHGSGVADMADSAAQGSSALEQARRLTQPSREAMLQRPHEVAEFWEEHRELLAEAWREWDAQRVEREGTSQAPRVVLDPGELYNPRLLAAVQAAWEEPEAKEHAVRELWTEVFPGVYRAQVFKPSALAPLREFMKLAADAGIPLRPPHGVGLIRAGVMLDKRSEGYLAAPTFQAFYTELIATVMRPVARLLFPEIVGYDSQAFGFSIAWQAGKDTALRQHTDASSVTLNINLNLPGEEFDGSAVGFFHKTQRARLSFDSGAALMHRGNILHVTEPITSGERRNWVLWLYGRDGFTQQDAEARGGVETRTASAAERWSRATEDEDTYAPF